MNDIFDALARFWGQFTVIDPANTTKTLPVKAYQSGYAIDYSTGRPAEPSFPYITYEVPRTDALDWVITSNSVWDRNSVMPWAGVIGRVNHILGQIEKAIPYGGVSLDLGGSGYLVLYRSPGDFISYLPETQEGTRETDNTIMRGLVRVMVKNYVL